MHFSIALLLHFVCELKCKPDVQHTPGRRQLFNCSPPISLLLLSWHYSNNISCNIVPHFLVNSPWFLFSERKYLISKIISFFGSVFLPLSFNSYLTAKDKKCPFTFLFSTYKPFYDIWDIILSCIELCRTNKFVEQCFAQDLNYADQD